MFRTTRIARAAAALVVVPGRRGLRIRAAGILTAVTIGLVGASAASANVTSAGVTFSSSVTCSSNAQGLEVMAGSNARAGSFAMIYLYDYRTGQWIHENQWHAVANYVYVLHGGFNFVGHSYYRVYMSYAQSTSSGWVYSGEYINRYNQRNTNGYDTYLSSTCYI